MLGSSEVTVKVLGCVWVHDSAIREIDLWELGMDIWVNICTNESCPPAGFHFQFRPIVNSVTAGLGGTGTGCHSHVECLPPLLERQLH